MATITSSRAPSNSATSSTEEEEEVNMEEEPEVFSSIAMSVGTQADKDQDNTPHSVFCPSSSSTVR